MKQLYYISALVLTSFTFITTFGIAVFNGATFYTSLLRGIGSAGIIFTLWLVLFIFIYKKAIEHRKTSSTKERTKENHKMEHEQEPEFKEGIQQLVNKQDGSQIDRDITEMLMSDPERATELLRKMNAK